jgi:hypothetical protein
MNYSKNYLNLGTVVYPPKLKMVRSILMLTEDQKREIASDTNDSCLRLYEFYINKKTWKHFNPTDYGKIGEALGWTARKTESSKTILVKHKYLLIKKDTLKDKTRIYRVLLGKDIVKHYLDTKEFPIDSEAFIFKGNENEI